MKRFRGIGVVLALVAMAPLVSGCSATGMAAPGPFVGLGGNPMAMLKVYSVDPAGHPLTLAQYRKVAASSEQCFADLGWQKSTLAESMISSGLAYGAMGAAGGAAQELFYAGVDGGAAAGYIGIVQALAGSVNGAQTDSYDMVHGIEKCVDDTILAAANLLGDEDLKFVRVVGSYVRSRNSVEKPARGTRERMPDFQGPRVGASVSRRAVPAEVPRMAAPQGQFRPRMTQHVYHGRYVMDVQ